MQKISRKEFLKSLGGLTAINSGNSNKSCSADKPQTAARMIRTSDFSQGKEFTTVCIGCDRGCGVLLTVQDGNIIWVEGDPDHPVNEGYLCKDAEALFSVDSAEKWTPELLCRSPGMPEWEVSDWGRTLRVIAQRIKKTRDFSFDEECRRTLGIACIRGNTVLNNEEEYLFFKFFRALGVVAMAEGGTHTSALSFTDWHKWVDEATLSAMWYKENALSQAYKSYLPERIEVDLPSLLMDKTVKGMFIWGGDFFLDEPAGKAFGSVENLEWLVLVDWFKTEKEFATKLGKIAVACPQAEIFCLPVAAPWEKTGSLVSAGRWVQWCTKAVNPRGQVRLPLWIVDRLYKDVREEYRKGGVFPGPIVDLKWDYQGDTLPDVGRVAAELSGYSSGRGSWLGGHTLLGSDSAAACGFPLLRGYWAERDIPSMRRGPEGKSWGFVLPQ